MNKTPEDAKRQVSFYCSREFWEIIHREKVRRGMSIQEMTIRALTEYFARPSVDDLRHDREIEQAAARKLEETGRVSVDELPASFRLQRWLQLCARYYERMPKTKRDLLEEFLVLDLKHYASSRLKKSK